MKPAARHPIDMPESSNCRDCQRVQAVHNIAERSDSCLRTEKVRLNAKERHVQVLHLCHPPLVAQGGATPIKVAC
eukprot:scaffold21052_cov61-Phaeocystis_antarctica.AAC.2